MSESTNSGSIDLEALENRLVAYTETGHHAKAERLIREALTVYPDEPDLLGWLGTSLGSQGRRDEALDALRRAISLDPDNDRLHWIRSRVLYQDGQGKAAIEAAEETSRLDPQDVENLKSQALILGAEQRFRKARDLARQALELAPEDGQLHGIVAVCERQLRNYDASERAFIEALRLLPDEEELWKEYALLCVFRGKVRESFDAYLSANRAKPSLDISADLSWPICVIAERPRWMLPLAVLLLALFGDHAGWLGAAARIGAALIAVGVLVDVVRWPVRGGAMAWRGLRASSRTHRVAVFLSTTALCASVALVLVSAIGGGALAWQLAIGTVVAMWLLFSWDTVVEVAAGEADAVPRLIAVPGMVFAVLWFDLSGLWLRVRRVFSGER